MAQPDLRIVSLIASSTETVHALGAFGQLVGRSHECDYPEKVMELPQLTRPRFDVHGTSGEVDNHVKSLVEQGLAVYEVFSDKLKAVNPDVILTQDHCEVCAVSLKDVEEAVCQWTDQEVDIVSLRPHCLADVYGSIIRVGEAIGREGEADRFVASMKERISAISETVSRQEKPRVAFIEWIDPPMSGGHWLPELVSAAGGESLFGESGKQSPWISVDEVAAADPDIILVAPCGYDIKTTIDEMAVLDRNEIWRGLRALRSNSVYVADGNAYFNRPGPRLVDSVEIVAEILHPDVANFGHAGLTFVRHDPTLS